MIKFRKSQKNEILDYKQIFIREYAIDLSENHGYSESEGLKMATIDFDDSFPNLTTIADDFLECIEENGAVVGYIWYGINRKYSKAFISDFYIFENYRNLGFGKSAISLLESILTSENINYLGLRVAQDNPRALSLYKNIGFNVSGINLCKRIK